MRRSIISVEDIGTTNLSCYSGGVMGYRRLIGLAKLLPSGQSLNRPPVFPAGIARQRGLPANIVRWMRVRDEIFEQVMSRGCHPERGAFVQHYDTDVLDASVLLMPLLKFISPTDPRWLSTLDLMGKELVSDSLVYRYNASASPDGLAGDEGTFSICSFWYVEALARAGRLDEARIAFEKMLTYANHLGCTRRRLARPARRSATSRRRSPTSR
jgi:hypothetical protein